MGRRTKTLLPTTTTKCLQPKLISPQAVHKELKQRKVQQKYYYDFHTATLRPIAVGETVMRRAKGKWEPATVVAFSQDGPRSYIVKTPGGSYRRNRHHLKPTSNNLNSGQYYQADQSCNDWLEDTSIIDESDATDIEIPASQGSDPSPPSQLRRSQRTVRKPSRYTDTDY